MKAEAGSITLKPTLKTTSIQTTSNPAGNTPAEKEDQETILLPGSGISVSHFARELADKLKDAPIFVRDEIVMTISDAGKLSEMKSEQFVTWIEDHVDPKKIIGAGKNRSPEMTSLNQSSANLVLSSPQFIRGLRTIRRVNQVQQPVIRQCGKLELLPKGYDGELKTWTRGTLDFNQDMPIHESLEFLENLLKEFPWPSNEKLQAKSIALTAMVSIFGDMLLEPNHQRPTWIFNANREGSGKTTLARLAICPSFGSATISPPPAAGKAGDLQKLLGATALNASPYLAFDNWSGKIGNPSLESFITSSTWSDRTLGVSKMFSVQKECIVLITGNHARVSPDMRRRSLVIDLEMIEACPEDRVIQNPLGEPEILEKRSEILSAIWAIIREWDKAGRPVGSHRHNSFANWGHLFGGMIENIGLVNPLTPTGKGADDTYRDFKIMLQEILEGSNAIEIGAGELLEHCRANGLFSWVIDSYADEADRSERAHFGKICSRFENSRFGDIEFKKGEVKREGKTSSRKTQYLVTRVTMS